MKIVSQPVRSVVRSLTIGLALPFAAITACATETNKPAGPAAAMQVAPPPVAPATNRHAADIAINREIFDLFLADTGINYNLKLSVDGGVVTLGRSLAEGSEQQRVVNELWQLPGVVGVTDDRGVLLAATHNNNRVAMR